MFFDLWSAAVLLISDSLELIGSYLPESSFSFTISIPFLLFLIFFTAICALGWRTTFIPELPEVPRPPYVIQISSTPTLNNNGEHNTLADVRLLSSGVDVDNLRRSFPTLLVRERGGGITRAVARGLSATSTSNRGGGVGGDNSQNQGGSGRTTVTNTGGQVRTQLRFHQVRQQHQQQREQRPSSTANQNQHNVSAGTGTAILQGLLRPGSVIRPLIQRATAAGGNHVQNLIVYHRVNVYHHHHHHHHSENGQTSSDSRPELPSNNSNPDSQSSEAAGADTNLTGIINTSDTTVPEHPSNRSSRSHSVDSSTQYEYVEGNSEDSASEAFEHLIDNPSSVNVDVNVLLGDVDSDPDGSSTHIELNNSSSSGNSEGSDNQNQSEREGLRLRRTVAFTDIRSPGGIAPEGEEDSTDRTPTTETANDAAMNKSETDGSTGERSASPSTSPTDIDANDIRFTIKFLNDTLMEVTTNKEEKVIDFKRRHFATELAENKKVRLIFNGRVLEDDSSTLRDSGIFDQCVVHCLIVSRPPPPQQSGGGSLSRGGNSTGRSNSQRANGGGILRGGAPEPGVFFVGFVGVFLIFLWFICFHFGQHLFTQSAVVSLTVLTAIFLVGLVAFYLPVHPANAAAA